MDSETMYQGWLDDQEKKDNARREAALQALPTVLSTLSPITNRVAGAVRAADEVITRTKGLSRVRVTVRARYCEMCEAWTAKRECPACGADTVPAARSTKKARR